MVHYKMGIEEIKERMEAVDAVLISDIPSHEKNVFKIEGDIDFCNKAPDFAA